MFVVHGALCMFVPVDFQDGQVLKSQEFRKSLKSAVCSLFSEQSCGVNFLATNCSHVLEMALRQSKGIASRRRNYLCLTPMALFCDVIPVRVSLNVLSC